MKKLFALLLILSFLLLSVSVTYAFIFRVYNQTNTFMLADVTPEIKETFNANTKTKQNVYIQNKGNVDIYVRVALVFSFEDTNGNILAEEPIQDEDYTISFYNSSKWVYKSDGYYYYKEKVPANASTDILVSSCQNIKNYTGKTFNLDIAVQSIQAEPERAVEEAWNVTIVNGQISNI